MRCFVSSVELFYASSKHTSLKIPIFKKPLGSQTAELSFHGRNIKRWETWREGERRRMRKNDISGEMLKEREERECERKRERERERERRER